jgi:hypothetical protein
VQLFQVRSVEERPEAPHAATIKPSIVLVLRTVNHVEIATQEPRSWVNITEGEQFIEEIPPSRGQAVGRKQP